MCAFQALRYQHKKNCICICITKEIGEETKATLFLLRTHDPRPMPVPSLCPTCRHHPRQTPTPSRTSLASSVTFSIAEAHVTVIEISRQGVAAMSVHAPAPTESPSPCLLLALLSDDRSARSRLSKTAPALPAAPCEAQEIRLPELSDHLRFGRATFRRPGGERGGWHVLRTPHTTKKKDERTGRALAS